MSYIYIYTHYIYIYYTLTFPKVRKARFSKTRNDDGLGMACFTRPGEVRAVLEYLSSI